MATDQRSGVVWSGAVGLGAVLLFFGLGELVLWAVDLPRGGPGVGNIGGNMVAEHLGGGLRPWQEEDPDLLWRFKRSQSVDEPLASGGAFHVSTNRDGMRGPEITLPPRGPMVLCAGDSVTAGFGVDDEEAYPFALQQLLRARPGLGDATVVNAGVFGYTSEQGRAALPQLLHRYGPAVVLLCYGINDDWPSIYPDAMLVGGRGWVVQVQRGLRRTRTYSLLRKQIVHAKMRSAVAEHRLGPRVPAERYLENLQSMIGLVRDAGATPILVAPTSRYGSHLRTANVELHAPISVYRELAEAVAAREGVLYLDHPLLSGRLRESRWAFVDWCHPGADALCLLATELAPHVAAALERR